MASMSLAGTRPRHFSIKVRSDAHLRTEHGALAPVRRILEGMAGAQEQAYRMFADALEIGIDDVVVEIEAGLDIAPYATTLDTEIRFSSMRARVALRGLTDIGDAERLRMIMERASNSHHPVRDGVCIHGELVLVP
jgi:hypothetical protein